MKRRVLEKKLVELGWRFMRHGGAHDLWTDGVRRLAIPRHREIASGLVRKILSRASSAKEQLNEV